jgi:hypothetical protein
MNSRIEKLRNESRDKINDEMYRTCRMQGRDEKICICVLLVIIFICSRVKYIHDFILSLVIIISRDLIVPKTISQYAMKNYPLNHKLI